MATAEQTASRCIKRSDIQMLPVIEDSNTCHLFLLIGPCHIHLPKKHKLSHYRNTFANLSTLSPYSISRARTGHLKTNISQAYFILSLTIPEALENPGISALHLVGFICKNAQMENPAFVIRTLRVKTTGIEMKRRKSSTVRWDQGSYAGNFFE